MSPQEQFTALGAPPEPTGRRRSARRLRKQPRWFVFALGVVLASWIAGMGGAYLGTTIAQNRNDPPRRASTMGIVTAPARTEPMPRLDVAAVAAVIGPSIVAIQATIDDGTRVGEAIGTGVIITSDGEIITNAHVVADATEVRVRLAGETEPRTAAVLAVDDARDLALLRVDLQGLSAAVLADPNDIQVGDEVLAVGYALDLDGDPSVTLGIVSALDRTLTPDDKVLGGLIQTDAAISSGNSGGPLVDALGRVVGINTLVALASGGNTANGLSFAISNRQVLERLPELRAAAEGASAEESGVLGVLLTGRTDGGSGALVVEITPGSPAEQVGLEVSDVVIAVDDRIITGQASLVATIRDLAPGTEVVVSVVRAGTPLDVKVTLAERPPD